LDTRCLNYCPASHSFSWRSRQSRRSCSSVEPKSPTVSWFGSQRLLS
jgi:hypothetical protein